MVPFKSRPSLPRFPSIVQIVLLKIVIPTAESFLNRFQSSFPPPNRSIAFNCLAFNRRSPIVPQSLSDAFGASLVEPWLAGDPSRELLASCW
ncbi:hypothetical protein Ccrd_003928 [Cynara cardunculus var. scolymus]|uniref:Uncharacterized protein n=1 Tax=Cynara cardunculus var. scolymus TaxID=59895 RepID=A0A103XNC7_CYNCS|nr:hypothetical protein Ccrd_003928 [Cynara cardunculus var. scolymus]